MSHAIQSIAMCNSFHILAQNSKSSGESSPTWKILLFAVVLVAVSGPWSRADVALLAGIALALCGLSSCAKQSKTASKRLIQACVVELGLRLDLSVVTHSGNVAAMAQSHSTQRPSAAKPSFQWFIFAVLVASGVRTCVHN